MSDDLHLSDAQLQDHLDGAASPEDRSAHLGACPSCTERLNMFALLHEDLQALNPGPPPTALAETVAIRIDAQRRRARNSLYFRAAALLAFSAAVLAMFFLPGIDEIDRTREGVTSFIREGLTPSLASADIETSAKTMTASVLDLGAFELPTLPLSMSMLLFLFILSMTAALVMNLTARSRARRRSETGI